MKPAKLTDKDIDVRVTFSNARQQWECMYEVRVVAIRTCSHGVPVHDVACLEQKRQLLQFFEDDVLDDELLALKHSRKPSQ